jgi:hypothetical protein
MESQVMTLETEVLDPVESIPVDPAPSAAADSAADPVLKDTHVSDLSEGAPQQDPPEQVRENHDLRRMRRFMSRAFEAEAQLEAMKRAQAQPPAPAQPQPLSRSQFADEAQYIEAVTAQAVQAVQAEARRQIEQSRAAERTDSFQKKAELVRNEIADYDEVINASSVIFPPAIQEVILSSEDSARLAYEIVKDDEYAERLAAMPPMAAAREVGRLEARIAAEKKKPAAPVSKPVSKAPAPIKPVAAKSGEVKPDPSKMSTDEWLRQRRKEKYKL